MSYKSAWEAVDAMNNLSAEPIVERETGGKNGGGTTITVYGKRLLETYRVLKEEHTRFLERLSSLPQLETGELQTIGRLSMQISARNQIQGKILSLSRGKVNVKLDIELKSGQIMHSVITKEAVENLGLEVGQRVSAIFKSSSVSVTQKSQEHSADNSMRGRVNHLIVGEERAEVIVDIGLGDVVVAVVAVQHIKDLKLQEGSVVTVVIRENDVMVGR
jgi:molybdate transport system regulatory protein